MSNALDFWEWAEEELANRGLTWYGVEKQAGLSNAAISRRALNRQKPTLITCRGIAKAFRLPEELLLQKAGLLPGKPGASLELAELLHLARRLDIDDLDRLLAIARTFSEGLQYTIRRDKALSVAENSGTDPVLDDSA